MSLCVCENRDGWLVAWGLCGCMLIHFYMPSTLAQFTCCHARLAVGSLGHRLRHLCLELSPCNTAGRANDDQGGEVSQIQIVTKE